MNIQWFPGHMAKTRRQITEDLKQVDIVYELLDARLPLSSKNPEIDGFLQGKPKIVVLNKADLADEQENQNWLRYYRQNGIAAVLVSSHTGAGIPQLLKLTQEILQDRLEALKAKGIVGRGMKVMIVGIPNVGKSSLINKLAGRAGAKTGDRPGVTTGKQWITMKNGMQLLDTPGILWPKFEDQEVGLRLAFSGAIKDELYDTEELAVRLASFLAKQYPSALKERYRIEKEGDDGYLLLEAIGRKRGCVISGGNIDTTKASIILLDEFRGAKLGRVTLEQAPGSGQGEEQNHV